MTIEEHTAKLEELKKAENEAERANILLEIANDYKETLTTISDSNARIDALEKENKRYSEVNSKLFLQLGRSAEESAGQGRAGQDSAVQEIPKKRSFDELENMFD